MNYDLIVLGGGPGGYVAAIRAGQLGMKTALVEKEAVGGTCLHHGCIPSKVLLQSANLLSLIQTSAEFGIEVSEIRPNFATLAARNEKIIKRLHRGLTHLMKTHQVDIYPGMGRFLSPMEIEVFGVGEDGSTRIQSERVIVATGSRARPWPNLSIDGKRVLTSDEALANPTPPRSIVVIGGGAVGVEMASFYSAFGTEVTIVEMAPFLLPTEDREVSLLLRRSMEKRGITLLTGASIDSIKDQGTDFILHLKGGATIRTDVVLVAIGRDPNTDGLDLKRAGVMMEANRSIWVNEKMQTSQRGIWAIGDVTMRPALAHGAMAQGIYVVETIAGIERDLINPRSIPNAIYCRPEVASVGMTEERAKLEGVPIKIARFPFSANPRALIENETEGFVKLICEESSGLILGAHLIGPNATELISEFVLAKNLQASVLDLKRTIHPHPTLSESIMEASGAILNQAIHL